MHEDKLLDAKKIVSKTDLISAMEAIEGAAIKDKSYRKRTPPSHEDMKKKALIRSLGRKPSEDKLALYVRKPSADNTPEENNVKMREKKPTEDSKKDKFLKDMARRSSEIPTDFLEKIEEEKKSNLEPVTNKKFPFNRTTTPNTLREHLKETLARNLGSSTDLAETIHAIRDDEILDTFNIDSENIETPPVQRRAFRHKSFRMSEQEDDNESDIGSDFSGRRKNHKFRTISGDGRPLGDREMLLKKKKESNTDLSEGRNATTDLEDELGSGLFDRFSTARKTINRNSMRKKKDDDTVSLSEAGDRRSDGWRNKLANRFRKSVVEYDLEEAERANGVSKEEPFSMLRREASDYLGQQTPMTEPTRRKPFNFDDTVDSKNDKKSSRNSSVGDPGRKSSYVMPGDYDSELVDGKYVTSVPIINVEQAEEQTSGNIRPGHSLKDLKKPTTRKNSIIDRLSKTKDQRAASTPAVNGSNVFDRLSSNRAGSRSNLNSSRPSLTETKSSSSSLSRAPVSSRATSLPPDKPRTTLNKIRDLSKDITKNLRKGKEEGLSSSTSVIQPRNSNGLFGDRERKPMSNLNGGSNPSINSSTRSLNKSATLNATRQNQRSTENIRNARNLAKSNGTPNTTTSRIGAKQHQPTSSKENLSRSSSSASRSSVTNMSRNGSLTMRTGVTSPTSVSTSNIRASTLSSNTLPRTRSTTLKNNDKNDDIPSYMKPTTARTKKVLNTTPSDSQSSLRKTSVGRMTTSSRVTPVGPRPSRR